MLMVSFWRDVVNDDGQRVLELYAEAHAPGTGTSSPLGRVGPCRDEAELRRVAREEWDDELHFAEVAPP